jgi:ribonuclease HI
MDITAVVEALCILPQGMHVWISTDSADVKRGTTDWMPVWINGTGGQAVEHQLRTSHCGESQFLLGLLSSSQPGFFITSS